MKVFYFSKSWCELLIIAVVCYLIGCFNFARLIARVKHKDITKMGSGNPGTMNMSREFGLKVGVPHLRGTPRLYGRGVRGIRLQGRVL